MPRSSPTALQRKLHSWELSHLRRLVAEQQEQIEQLQRDLAHAESAADLWRDDALQAIEDAGCTPGLTLTGHVVALPAQVLQ